MLDVSKEAGAYGVGAAYIENRLRLIKAMNPQGRLITAHGGLLQSNTCPPELCSMSTQETHFTHAEGNSMAHTQSIWYGNLTSWVRPRQEMPVLMAEFYYEQGAIMPCIGKACVKSPQELIYMRMVMWDTTMAGLSFNWYNTDLAWDIIVPNTTSAGFRYVKILSNFWRGVGFEAMEPRNDMLTSVSPSKATVHCLASGAEVVVHVRTARATFGLNVTGTLSAGSWYDPENGHRTPARPAVDYTSAKVSYTQPTSIAGDAVLHLKRVGAGAT